MAEYISKQDVIDYLNGYLHSLGEDADTLFNRGQRRALTNSIQDILAVKAAEVQPAKHGRWTYPYKDKDINQCSECRSCVQDKISNVREMFAYCPFCGARMDLND